jgi:hypothetical protein
MSQCTSFLKNGQASGIRDQKRYLYSLAEGKEIGLSQEDILAPGGFSDIYPSMND